MKRLDQLTFTRFIAALTVVIFHNGRTIFPFNIFPINPLFTSGTSAVGYFFVLSGFVMSLAYYRPDEKIDTRGFWLARFSRIFPIYLVSLLLTCLHFMDATVRAKAAEYLSALLLMQAWVPDFALTFNFPAWSLSIEVFFYLFFPALAIWMARSKWSVRAWIWLSIALWTVNQLIVFVLGRIWPNTPFYDNLLSYFPPMHLSLFLLGTVGGMWYVRVGQSRISGQAVTRWMFLLGLGLMSAGLISKGSVGIAITKGLLAPFFLVIILSLAMETSILARALSQPWMIRLGDASYGIYILHMPVRWIATDVTTKLNIHLPPLVDFLLYVLLLIFISLLMYSWIEKPARDWLREHPARLSMLAGDTLLLVGALYLSYLVRVGLDIRNYIDSLNLAVRLGIPAYLFLLILFRAYNPDSDGKITAWALRVLAPASTLGILFLTGLLFFASRVEWIGTFPRSMLAVNLVLSAGFLYAHRYLLHRWKFTPAEK